MPTSILDNLKKLDMQIFQSLASHPSLAGMEDVEFHTSENHIRLRGKVGSFFEKQIAQEAIRSLDSEREIENELMVNWS